MTISKINKTLFYIFVCIFPIIPDYFRIFDYRISSIITYFIILLVICNKKMYTKLKFKSIIFPMAILFITIPFLYSGDFIAILTYLGWFIFIPLYVIVNIDSNKSMNLVLTILSRTGLIVAILSLFELFGYNIFSIFENYDIGTMSSIPQYRLNIPRLEGPFGQSIVYALYLSAIIIIYLYKIDITTNKNKKITYIFITVFLNIVLLLTISRFPIAVILILEFLYIYKHLNNLKRILLVCSGFIIIILSLNLITYSDNVLLQIIKSTFLTFTNQSANITDFGTNANPFEYRLSLFEISKKIVGGNYIFGLGYSPDTSFSIESDIFSYAPSIETSIDNAYLCMYIEGGLVAIMGWLFYYMFFIKKTYNNYKYNGNKLYIYILIIVFLYLINLFSVSRMGEIRLYAVIFGLSIKNLKKDYNVI